MTTATVVLPADLFDREELLVAADTLCGPHSVIPVLGFYVAAWLYCVNQHTDGFVPASWVIESRFVRQPLKVAAALVREKLWEETETGWRIRDFVLCEAHATPAGPILRKREQERLKKRHQRGTTGQKSEGSNRSLDLDLDLSTTTTSAPAVPLSPVAFLPSDLLDLYNTLRGELPKCAAFSEARKKEARKRLREVRAYLHNHTDTYTTERDLWTFVITTIAANPWFAGANDRRWRADIDYVLRADTWTRALEGKFTRRAATPRDAAEAKQHTRATNLAHVTKGAICVRREKVH